MGMIHLIRHGVFAFATLGLASLGHAQEAPEFDLSQVNSVLPGWRVGPELDNPRAGLNAVEFEGVIYAAGGAGLVDPRDDFESYDPLVGQWRFLAPLPVGLERFGLTAGEERLWIAGGYSAESGSEPIASVWSYDPEADVWQSETEMPGPKASFSLIAIEGRLYAIGGEDGSHGVFVYDIDAQSWSTVDAPPETNRRGASVIAVNQKIWLIGGASAGVATGRVDIYDPASDLWTIGPALPAPRAGHAAALIGDEIHVFGGRSADMRLTLDDHLKLSVTDRVWQDGPKMMIPRTEAAAATLDGEIFLIGGGAGSGFFAPFTAVDSVDILTIPNR